MTRGIRRHKTFLLFLTKGSLLREFCQYELRLAIRLQKQIVIVDEAVAPPGPEAGRLPLPNLYRRRTAGRRRSATSFRALLMKPRGSSGPSARRRCFKRTRASPFFRDDEFRRGLSTKLSRGRATRGRRRSRGPSRQERRCPGRVAGQPPRRLALIRRRHVELQQLRARRRAVDRAAVACSFVYDPGETDGTILRLKDHLKDLCTWPIEIMSDSPVTESHTVLLF